MTRRPAAHRAEPRKALVLRLLGEMEVVRDGAAVPLPPSKKTRALLAYLALSGGQHRRERLCALLWDVADDPRGALRWSLSKLRGIVDEPGRERIAVDRDSVSFHAHGARVDLHAIRDRLKAGAESLSIEQLESLAEDLRGEFLEGLDLSDFHDFHAWCVAMREDVRNARVAVHEALVRRLEGEPGRALPFARGLVQADPFSATARGHLLRLLAAAGRLPEAVDHFETARRVLHEAGPAAVAALTGAWDEIRSSLRATPEASGAVPTEPEAAAAARPGPPLVGRADELARLQALLDDAAARRRGRIVLLFGEPGIGKSRLLASLVASQRNRGGLALEGRCFEAECGRPYGPWTEALRRLPPAALGGPLARSLAPLLGLAPQTITGEETRERLFGAVVDLIAARATSPAPLLIALDDVHWCDAASAELLHYVARLNQHRPVVIALAAREGELMDNDPIRRLLRGLRSEMSADEIHLHPLGREEVAALARAIAPDADAQRVFEQSRGNPLYAAELARAGRPPGGELPARLHDVVRDRIDRLPAEPAEVLRWAAAFGAGCRADRLAQVVSLGADRLVAALETLERHALLGAGAAEGHYSFSHDVVRGVVYAGLSDPRRRLMHARIARVLQESSPGDDSAADRAHHAVLAGDAEMAARACAEAGRRCLRIFASADAFALAVRGARFAGDLPEPDRTKILIELTEIQLAARRPADPAEAARELEALAERAIDLGCTGHARLGFHILGWLRWEEGDARGARRHVMRAEAVSRSGGDHERAVAMGEAARCLALLQKDLAEAEALALEARALSKRAGFEPAAVADALGMLRAHEGRHAEAVRLFNRARSLAQHDGDSMGEFLAIEHLIAVALERGDVSATRRLSADLTELGTKLREGSEAPFARAIDALARCAAGERAARGDLARAIGDLRGADAKQRIAFILIRASRVDLDQGDVPSARACAEEALALAGMMNLPSDGALARAALVRAAERMGDGAAAREHREALAASPGAILSAAARSSIEQVAEKRPQTLPRKRRAP